MKLTVRIIEARNLPAMDLNGLSDPYVRLQLGKQRNRTKVVKKCLNPYWGHEFNFRVENMNDELVISILDEDRYFNDDFMGQIKVPMSQVFDADNKSLGICWYPLQGKNKKSKNKEFGEICVSVYFCLSNTHVEVDGIGDHVRFKNHRDITDSPSRSCSSTIGNSSPARREELTSSKEEKSCKISGRIAQIFNKNSDAASATSSMGTDSSRILETSKPEVYENNAGNESLSCNFEETMKAIESKFQESEIPSNLPGGVLLDHLYATAPSDLNSLLFSPDSNFTKLSAEAQGTTEMEIGPWNFDIGGELKRVLTYIKAATKLLKAVKGTEEQMYLKADENGFAVLANVSTPDAPYGSTFKVELLYCITSGPVLPSGEQSSHLVISWRLDFLQSTMMKGFIQSGARQGLMDSFEQYERFLSKNVTPVDLKDIGSDKEQILDVQAEPQSDWKLAKQFFANLTVVSAFFMGLYVLVHIWLTMPSTIKGLEFAGLDLPDSIGEVIVSGILVLQLQRVIGLISRFMQARTQKDSDHGIKAQGEGWLLTIALLEGSDLAAVDSHEFSDPYVVFTCNGKTRTSSIKFQKIDPRWNEIFEFDAMSEPPSMLSVEVFDFDGPFDEATSLGYAEINFVKTNLADLADVWVPLQGKLAQACQSKLHLRIVLNNTRGGNGVLEYLSKMEKEVGKKINLRSPQTNSAFQKLFGLPSEEFLINDFTCHLKRKLVLQGRLFLSARIVGFHANLFGRKTKFYFLWEDIEDIKELDPTLASMGSPIIVMTLRPGRGMDARHGAKTQDAEGRLKFHFHSFVSFNVANRTIMALWKARYSSPEQKVQMIEDESEAKLQSEESGSFLGIQDVSMSEVYSSDLPLPISLLMELFSGGDLEHRVMEKVGCHNYSTTQWELEKDEVYERQIYYRFDKRVSRYRGEVTSAQQRTPLPDRNGWLLEETMTLHAVPLGDYFSLHLRYQIEDSPSRSKECHVKVFIGISWLKSTTHQKRITKNVLQNLQDRLKVMFSVVEKEL